MSLPTWIGSRFCVPLVLTLGHFLWQATAVVLLATAAGVALRRATPRVRYGLFVLALSLTAACPVVTFPFVSRPPVSESSPTAGHAEVVIEPAEAALPTAGRHPVPTVPDHPPAVEKLIPRPQEAARTGWERFAPYATVVYLVGVSLMLLRLALGLHGGRRLRRLSEPVEDVGLLAALTQQAKALSLRLMPAVAYCERVAVPSVVGVLRPMILLPASLASGLTTEQIEAILTHELAHIRRHDHLVNLLQRVIESLLFFHPAVWFLSRRIRTEREHCCDDLAVATCGQRSSYAESLLRLAEMGLVRRRGRLGQVAVLGASDGSSRLRRRIVRLFGATAHERVRLFRSWAIVGVFLTAILGAAYLLMDGRAGTTGPPQGGKPPAPSGASTQPAMERQRHLKALIEQLQAPEHSKRAEALRELGQMGPAARLAIPMLAVMYVNENSELAEVAGDLLKKMGPSRPEDVPGLVGWLKHKEHAAFGVAMARLAHLGPHAKPAIPILVEMLKDDHEWVRPPAASTLREIGSEAVEAALAYLRPALKDENRRVRFFAVDSIHFLGVAAKAALPDLQKALADQSRIVRENAAQTLGEWGAEAVSASGSLVPLLKDKSPSVRRKAAEALARMGELPADVAKQLPHSLAGQDEFVQIYIAIALARSGQTDPWIGRIAEATRKKYQTSDLASYDIHMLAVVGLGDIGPVDDRVVPALIGALGTDKTWIRMRAAESLAGCGPGAKDAVRPLVQAALHDDEINVRHQAAYAIGCIALADERAIAAMRKLAKQAPSPVTATAGFALVRMGKAAEGLPAILKVLRGDDAGWRLEAAELLGKLGRAARSAAPLLERAIRQAPSAAHRRRLRAVVDAIQDAPQAPSGASTQPAARRAVTAGKPFDQRPAVTLAQATADVKADSWLLWTKEGPSGDLKLIWSEKISWKPGGSPTVLVTAHQASDQAELLRFYGIENHRYVPQAEIGNNYGSYDRPRVLGLGGHRFVLMRFEYQGSGGGSQYQAFWIDRNRVREVLFEDPVKKLKSLLADGEHSRGWYPKESAPLEGWLFAIWRRGEHNNFPTGGTVTGSWNLVLEGRRPARFEVGPGYQRTPPAATQPAGQPATGTPETEVLVLATRPVMVETQMGRMLCMAAERAPWMTRLGLSGIANGQRVREACESQRSYVVRADAGSVVRMQRTASVARGGARSIRPRNPADRAAARGGHKSSQPRQSARLVVD